MKHRDVRVTAAQPRDADLAVVCRELKSGRGWTRRHGVGDAWSDPLLSITRRWGQKPGQTIP
jgi:hypothetical protein